jgi:hypothetical protein
MSITDFWKRILRAFFRPYRPTAGERRIHRICYDCGRPIKRAHSWHIDGGRVCHRDCKNPIKQHKPIVDPNQLNFLEGAKK